MNVNIAVLILVISHGHDDHGGGLNLFFRKTAKPKPFHPKPSKVLFIALSGQSRTDRLGWGLETEHRVYLPPDYYSIDKGFGCLPVSLKEPRPNQIKACSRNSGQSSDNLPKTKPRRRGWKNSLVTGCAHNASLTLLSIFNLKKRMPDYVIADFIFQPFLKWNSDKIDKSPILGTKQNYTGHWLYSRMKAEIGHGRWYWLPVGRQWNNHLKQ